MQLEVNRHSATPIAQQLETAMRAWIAAHGAGGGRRLPSIRRLAASHNISRNAVIEAYERLVASGLVRSQPGSGFYVADSAAALVSPSTTTNGMEEITNGLWGLFSANEHTLKLGCGWLPSDWREGDDLTHAIRQVARKSRSGIFEYSTPQGPQDLRGLIQERLRPLAITADAQQIVTTSGGSHSLDLLVRMLLDPGDVVFVESPGYYNLFGLLHLQRVRVIGVPRLADGPDIERLEALLAQHRPKLLYINSVFHNPTGSTLTPAIAHRVLQLAEQHDFQIIEDDIYADFQHTPTTRLAALDGLNRVFYLGSFSKSLSSSLRVGFIAAPTTLVQRLVDIKMLTSISASRFAEQVVTVMLQNGSYRKLTERLRIKLANQMAMALTMLNNAGWEVYIQPAGGMFVWAKPPTAITPETLSELANRWEITLSPGHLFFADHQPTPWLRLNVAYMQDPRAKAFIEAAQ
ncbi:MULTISPECIES: PLP-dependent aminotransferase family protein [unclassified Halomonas]|uniref:aminotransferase-like domain-containing protein n=1 Tax=unclassified Halomonas TaxID=2609666 RepID=UPI0007D9992D|nr:MULTISPECIES: PLP-dependent aminotransferase family protein [unclassified Halomonas]MBT2787148.1 PLP-dependent aminotransferase family protein [Halomonas sp. ISL-106]MBT2795490.1 PLP-dependent aminotransferase family protein [Halomonas sp. ISL-104]OAL57987.1 GntR family transcriptional regulator [Halomonas sp. ALS9]